jgi:hypothetical protein
VKLPACPTVNGAVFALLITAAAPVTWIVTVVAGDIPPDWFFDRYVKLSVPAKLGLGVYENDPSALSEKAAAWDGPEARTADSTLLPGSLASTPGAACLSVVSCASENESAVAIAGTTKFRTSPCWVGVMQLSWLGSESEASCADLVAAAAREGCTTP